MHDLGGKKNCRKKASFFVMWALFYLRNIALNFFSLGCSSFLGIKVCKKGTQVIKAECFFCMRNISRA